MNMNPSPQAVPGPVPPAPDLGSCVLGIRQSIIDWSETHPILGRLADPVTIQILALLQVLADLFARFAAGELSPRAPTHVHPGMATPTLVTPTSAGPVPSTPLPTTRPFRARRVPARPIRAPAPAAMPSARPLALAFVPTQVERAPGRTPRPSHVPTASVATPGRFKNRPPALTPATPISLRYQNYIATL